VPAELEHRVSLSATENGARNGDTLLPHDQQDPPDQPPDLTSEQASSSFVGQRYMASLNKQGRMGQTLLAVQEMRSTQVSVVKR